VARHASARGGLGIDWVASRSFSDPRRVSAQRLCHLDKLSTCGYFRFSTAEVVKCWTWRESAVTKRAELVAQLCPHSLRTAVAALPPPLRTTVLLQQAKL
jgi:hypothetical protein